MDSNIGDPELLNRLNDLQRSMTNGVKLMGRYGREYARAERDYKVELSQEALRLKDGGMKVTLIAAVIHGRPAVAEKRFKRDLAEALYKTAQENINVLKLQARLLEEQIDREYRG